MGRSLPEACPHGAITDWGDFGAPGATPEPCVVCEDERPLVVPAEHVEAVMGALSIAEAEAGPPYAATAQAIAQGHDRASAALDPELACRHKHWDALRSWPPSSRCRSCLAVRAQDGTITAPKARPFAAQPPYAVCGDCRHPLRDHDGTACPSVAGYLPVEPGDDHRVPAVVIDRARDVLDEVLERPHTSADLSYALARAGLLSAPLPVPPQDTDSWVRLPPGFVKVLATQSDQTGHNVHAEHLRLALAGDYSTLRRPR